MHKQSYIIISICFFIKRNFVADYERFIEWMKNSQR